VQEEDEQPMSIMDNLHKQHLGSSSSSPGDPSTNFTTVRSNLLQQEDDLDQDLDSTLELLDQPFDMESPKSLPSDSLASSKCQKIDSAAVAVDHPDQVGTVPMPSLANGTTPSSESLSSTGLTRMPRLAPVVQHQQPLKKLLPKGLSAHELDKKHVFLTGIFYPCSGKLRRI
jgi:hypothetical protein